MKDATDFLPQKITQMVFLYADLERVLPDKVMYLANKQKEITDGLYEFKIGLEAPAIAALEKLTGLPVSHRNFSREAMKRMREKDNPIDAILNTLRQRKKKQIPDWILKPAKIFEIRGGFLRIYGHYCSFQ